MSLEYCFLVIFIGIISYILFVFMKRSSNIDNATGCKDMNCIRCQKYSEIKERSIRLFQNFIDNEKFMQKRDLKRIRSSLLQIHDGVEINSNQRPNVFFLRGLNSSPWFEHFDTGSSSVENDIRLISENFNMIYNEFCEIVDTPENHWLVNNTPNGCWEVFHLINQGKIVEHNVHLVPKTFKFVQLLSSAMLHTLFGNVAFSVVYPGTKITDHYGPTNIRLRCHLGLETSPNCTLTVNGVKKTWTKGKTIVFDDSYLHGVQYVDSNNERFRAVLILDLWHPNLTWEEREALNYIFSADE